VEKFRMPTFGVDAFIPLSQVSIPVAFTHPILEGERTILASHLKFYRTPFDCHISSFSPPKNGSLRGR
jgi:hypothetical protein